VIGTIPIGQITPHEALAVLRKIEATGAYESARRMRSVLSRVFRYGVATVRCNKDVAADLRGAIAAPKVKHFAAITKPWEVGALLRAIDGYSGHKVTVMAMRLSPHVLLRPGELRQAESWPAGRGSNVCLRKARKAPLIASSSMLSTVECAFLGPGRISSVLLRLRHLATVFGLIPCRLARTLRLS